MTRHEWLVLWAVLLAAVCVVASVAAWRWRPWRCDAGRWHWRNLEGDCEHEQAMRDLPTASLAVGSAVLVPVEVAQPGSYPRDVLRDIESGTLGGDSGIALDPEPGEEWADELHRIGVAARADPWHHPQHETRPGDDTAEWTAARMLMWAQAEQHLSAQDADAARFLLGMSERVAGWRAELAAA